ncbi:hypothetical protein HD553DRAFT_121104 [Filobasidium floriforme]|uniref:uncharacterized protein n=1 Tax=Filobasidium floriforme TaxID=5210 RepID=UPI001E8CFFB4|nr:uncharacterized protein HD553DRAFT_121104 [Filobasidium floriforme]KAH8080161.1 hypothetical protein HD553DRAFT_121104 [Filobasidium floriforme]
MAINGEPLVEDSSQGVSRTVAFLPLGCTDGLANPESFTRHLQEAVRSTSDALAVIFYWPSRKVNPISDLSPVTRQADWDVLQRFLGVMYGCAGREAAVLDRPLLEVLVLIDGLMDETCLRGKVSKIILLNEVGLNDVARFLETSPEPQMVTRFSKNLRQAGDDSVSPSHPITAAQEKQDHRHDVTALGGTFDHLHGGHKILLTMAVAITKRRLVIGLTTDVMLKTKSHAELLEPFETRTQHLQTFLRHLSTDIEYDIIALRDTYGPTATDELISALIVSRESAAGGLAIDQVRETNGLTRLRTYVIDVISGNHAEGAQAREYIHPTVVGKSERRLRFGRITWTW